MPKFEHSTENQTEQTEKKVAPEQQNEEAVYEMTNEVANEMLEGDSNSPVIKEWMAGNNIELNSGDKKIRMPDGRIEIISTNEKDFGTTLEQQTQESVRQDEENLDAARKNIENI